MLYVICLWILHNELPDSALSWEVCYIYFLCRSGSSTTPELYLHFYWYFCASYNGVFIDIFVYVIQSNRFLYFILGIFTYIYPMYGLFFHCIFITFAHVLICLWMLYLCLLKYFGVINTIYYLVVPHLGNLVMDIYHIWFVMPLLPASFTYIHKSVLITLFLN